MIFINPIWDNESERIGKSICTPLGYKLHVISDIIGFFGLLLLLGIFAYLGYRGFTGAFHLGLFWLIAIPIGIGILGSFIYRYSWILAARKQWMYNYENREASWMEDGQRRTYKWKT